MVCEVRLLVKLSASLVRTITASKQIAADRNPCVCGSVWSAVTSCRRRMPASDAVRWVLPARCPPGPAAATGATYQTSAAGWVGRSVCGLLVRVLSLLMMLVYSGGRAGTCDKSMSLARPRSRCSYWVKSVVLAVHSQPVLVVRSPTSANHNT